MPVCPNANHKIISGHGVAAVPLHSTDTQVQHYVGRQLYLTDGRRLEKTRHVIAAGEGLNIEVDVYAGALTGLSVAEVEFRTEAAADAFQPPAWFGREVTDDARFKNQRLASDGVPADAGQ